MTIREKILAITLKRPRRTATEIARALHLYHKLPSISSVLRKMAREGILIRYHNVNETLPWFYLNPKNWNDKCQNLK